MSQIQISNVDEVLALVRRQDHWGHFQSLVKMTSVVIDAVFDLPPSLQGDYELKTLHYHKGLPLTFDTFFLVKGDHKIGVSRSKDRKQLIIIPDLTRVSFTDEYLEQHRDELLNGAGVIELITFNIE